MLHGLGRQRSLGEKTNNDIGIIIGFSEFACKCFAQLLARRGLCQSSFIGLAPFDAVQKGDLMRVDFCNTEISEITESSGIAACP
ncbi:hypothetical protein [Agrobacterium tumefaciens]|uniref:hypothetical protein n=1 Tax=Agrobacterium tumefaciens TaxID=358 RepID=UPI00287C468A|nr:hypothetical protein [Agrobacterium tumefaciens]MDS7595102.1 hypothetical protein [Agrobacterium tumefaciens]